jgi:hypothetical protein
MHKSATEREQTHLDRMERWFRNQPVLSVLILASIILVGIGEVVQRGSEMLVTLGLKEEKTLKLAADNAKGEFSRKLTELAWRRIFWTQNNIARLKAKRPQSELDYSWGKHLDTVADWSADYLVNVQGMDEFYPRSGKAAQFEAIHESLRDLEDCRIVPLRMLDSNGRDHSTEAQTAKDFLDRINVSLYFLVLNQAPDKTVEVPPPPIAHNELCPQEEALKNK